MGSTQFYRAGVSVQEVTPMSLHGRKCRVAGPHHQCLAGDALLFDGYAIQLAHLGGAIE